jgi:hypothetical protein
MPPSSGWADALERRRTYYKGTAKRLGLTPKQARSLASPTITVKPSTVSIVSSLRCPS